MPVFHDHPVGALSWFRTKGRAAYFLRADTLDELVDFLKNNDEPFHILGNGSNTLIRDGGVSERVIKLGKGFRAISCDRRCDKMVNLGTFCHPDFSQDPRNHPKLLDPAQAQDDRTEQTSGFSHTLDSNQVTIGAACLNRMVVSHTANLGLSGLEFLVGIPGSIGGAVAMNAGACGSETKDHLVSVRVCLPDGSVQTLSAADLNMTYRHTELPSKAIVVDATFQLEKKDPAVIQKRVAEFLAHRDDAQPKGGRTGGSTFKNPPDQSAWKYIDAVDLRGYSIGGAQFSDKHCNFIMNAEDGCAQDIEDLGTLAQRRVKEQFDVDLQWEVRRIGVSG